MKTSIRNYVLIGTVLLGFLANVPIATGQSPLERLEDRVQIASNVSLGLEAEERGFEAPYEIVVIAVRPGTAAASAGLMPGDLLTTADGKPVGTIDQLATIVRSKSVGDRIRIGYLRQGVRRESVASFVAAKPALPISGPPRNSEIVGGLGPDTSLETSTGEPSTTYPPMRLDQREPSPEFPSEGALRPLNSNPIVERPQPGSGRLGVTVENVETTPPGPGVPVKRGAVVVQVDPASPAGSAGIKPGDVIVAMDGVVIRDAAALIEEVSKTVPGQQVEFGIYQGPSLARIPLVLASPAVSGERSAIPRLQPLPNQNPNGANEKSGGLFGALGGFFGGGRSDKPAVVTQPSDPPTLQQPPAMLPSELGQFGSPLPVPLPSTPANSPESLPGPSTPDRPAADPLNSATQSKPVGNEIDQLKNEISLLRKQLEAMQRRLDELEQKP